MNRRCTYCLQTKLDEHFTTVEHVIPAALGGNWTTREVCNSCQTRANQVADELIIKDFLVVFLRAAYGIGDRKNRVPPAPYFTLPIGQGGAVKVTVEGEGAELTGLISPAVAALLGLEGESGEDQARLRELVGEDVREMLQKPVELARARQIERTPPDAWSRFMAKLALACGRQAYGDQWMDGSHAHRLSLDLRWEEPPKLSAQREHFPPLGETWPFLPPRHVLWIDDVADTAILHVVLFGQLLGAVPVNKAGEPSEYSAWRFNPENRDFNHSSYPAIWHGTAAALATRGGRNVVSVVDAENSFTYIEDGPNGPMDIPVPTLRADSPADALRVFAKHRGGGGAIPTTDAEGNRQRPPEARKTGRNKPCPCGSGRKYKQCCG
jgi:hypothetical protein